LKTQIILKLVHSCNFACKYCNYAHVMASKPGAMDLELVAEVFKKCSASNSSNEISFIFHGGEPAIAGVEYFREIVALQERYLGAKTYTNIIQTNGSLLSEALIDLFTKHDFHLSISLDGPQAIHDANRVFKSGSGTHAIIMENLGLLHKRGIGFSVLAVHSELMRNPGAIYAFFKSIAGLRALDFLAMSNTVKFQKRYGPFLADIFDIWFNDCDCGFEIRVLNSMVKSLLKLGPAICQFRQPCVLSANVIAIDPYGNVYPCDRELFNDYLLGNIRDEPIDTLLKRHSARKKFAMLQKEHNESCKFCEWYFHCGGGCPGNYDDITKQNAYCADYRLLFEHITAVLKEKSIMDDSGNINAANITGIPNPSLVNSIKKVHNAQCKCKLS
jgi:uncharacterized protein